ncbi:MAG: GNAT family N-acetyltransferase [Rhodospirillales bacterium]|nr:GNAT family N-acetyltransferase [Alphaproteobacteria bacterium]MCB9986403.1 GNAT family N-acetyltransferase [Rhodospirillales bacterium]USO07049.1 MAG: GNAT family N-acetyltransferase [Rhodospirillales bacterium]
MTVNPALRSRVRIVPMTREHTVGWRTLWHMNVGNALEKPVIDYTERMILDAQAPLFALLAITEDGEIAGLLHGVVHPVAGSMNPICYMQDLYVHPARRRQGIAARLIESLAAMGRVQKWDRIYWLTDKANTEAQALYRNKAIALDFTFHILPLGMLDKIGVAS